MLVLAVLGAVVGVLLPLHIPHPVPRTEYEAATLVGVTPGGGPPTLGQIDFFAAQQQVIVDAAQSVGVKGSPAALEKAVTVAASNKKAKSSPNGTVSLAVSQPTAARSARLTNAFAKTLANYIQNQLNNDYQNELNAEQSNVCNLEAEVNSVDSQIAQIVAPNAPGASSTGATPPNGITCNNNSSSGSSGNSTSSAYFPGSPRPGGVVLTDDSGSTTTDPPTTTTAPTTTTTTPSGPNTAKTNPELADLEAQSQAVTQEYVTAVAKEQAVSDAGPQQSGFIILDPAQAAQAKVIPGGLSILDHRSVRGGIGILGGAALGLGVGMLLAGLDKTLRTAPRAEETFGLPVIAEIPAPAASSPRRRRLHRGPAAPPPPPVPVLTEPASKRAEAYRMLRMALEFSPRPAGVGAGAGVAGAPRADGHPQGNGQWPATAPVASMATGAQARATTPLWINDPPVSAAVSPPVAPAPGRTEPPARRQPMLLVVAPAAEPTRALVIANLAATYTESGLSVYIVTCEDLRSHGGSIPPAGLFEPPSGITAEEVLAHSNPTQITGVRRLGLGNLLDGPGQLAASAHEVLAVCRQLADVVLVDAPSLLSTYDAETLVPEVDRVLVVAEVGVTTVDQARQTGALLERIHAPVAGVVLTNTPPSPEDVRAARKASATAAAGSRSRRARQPSGPSALRRSRRDKAARRLAGKRTSAPKRDRRTRIGRHRRSGEPQREPG